MSDRFESAVNQIFEEGIASGDFSASVPASILTQAMIGMANETRRWFRPGRGHSGEEIADQPCMEVYLNDCGSLPPKELLTDLCIPLKDA